MPFELPGLPFAFRTVVFMMEGFPYSTFAFPDQVHENELNTPIIPPINSLGFLGWFYLRYALPFGGCSSAA